MSQLLRFPVWKFLNEPLFETDYQPVLSPGRFWRLHQIEFLERCLEREAQAKRRD